VQAASILAGDFFTAETVWLKTLYLLFFIEWGPGGALRRLHGDPRRWLGHAAGEAGLPGQRLRGALGPDDADGVSRLAPHLESDVSRARAPRLCLRLQPPTTTPRARVGPPAGPHPLPPLPRRCPSRCIGETSSGVCSTSITRPRCEPRFVHPSSRGDAVSAPTGERQPKLAGPEEIPGSAPQGAAQLGQRAERDVLIRILDTGGRWAG